MTLAITLKLHTKVLHFMTKRLYDNAPLRGYYILYPASLILIKLFVNKSDTSSTTTPGSLNHNLLINPKGLLHLRHQVRLPRFSNGSFELEFSQQIYCILTMRQIANHGYLLFRRHRRHTIAKQKTAQR